MSTTGRNVGCAVTSSTRSTSTQTSRPSRIDSRYSSPVFNIGSSALSAGMSTGSVAGRLQAIIAVVSRRVFQPALAPPPGLAGPSLYFAVRRSELLLAGSGGAVAVPSLEAPSALGVAVEAEHFLGTLDGIGCVALA